ncbi:MAG: hypothetical protein N3D73_01560 [Candidatus Diapherotrites archaeon]|nr:hypothetical protein [Candidatus Diapherotrites archaeon]
MGKEKDKGSKIDSLYNKISSKITSAISNFVASLFIIFTLGAIYGVLVVNRWPHHASYLILAPLLPALLAYYDRTFATAVFLIILIFFIFL